MSMDFSVISHHGMRHLAKLYLGEQLPVIGLPSVMSSFYELQKYLKLISFDSSLKEAGEELVNIFKKNISELSEGRALHKIYRPVQFYIWGAMEYPDLCFSEQYGFVLDEMTIPGGPKGEAVRTEDIALGPLHLLLELPRLTQALELDCGQELEHHQQRAAVALCIAFGPNPRVLTYCNEEDVLDLTPDADSSTYQINLPRIKKGFMHPRENMRTVGMSTDVAKHVVSLIEKNQETKAEWVDGGKTYKLERRLFVSKTPNPMALKTKNFADIYNLCSCDISYLLKAFVSRMKILSPITGNKLQLNARRLRYTFATSLVMNGISKRGLAIALDHSDTQNVGVYFALKEMLVDMLDNAAKGGYSNLTGLFKGEIIATDMQRWSSPVPDQIDYIREGTQEELGRCGSQSLCGLDPPFSCYLCPLFKAYRFANHRAIRDQLILDRDHHRERYRSVGFQFDHLIQAINEVIYKCELTDATTHI
ncbi:hypothetical protein [Pseudomonas sp. NPDC099000]|uniref:hypothetical protein n=1 Tax=Pseudomonas sp. NPDC099000 TaxID=3364488 RepID=UPI00383BD366